MSTAYVDAALIGELAKLHAAQEGERNSTLFRTAARLYQFAEAGVLDHDALTAQLAQEAAQLGLTRREVRATLRSAAKRARGHAADLPRNTRAAGGHRRGVRLAVDDPEVAEPPSATWQVYARGFCGWAMRNLWHAEGTRGMVFLTKRRLHFGTIAGARLGYNLRDFWDERAWWGLQDEHDERGRLQRIWVPRGIVIPWIVDGAIWRVFIRRLLTDAQVARGEPKYVQIPGGTNALYNAASLRPHTPAMLVEGVFDALAVQQVAGDLLAPVASGTTGARRVRWIAALVACQPVLLSFDADVGGAEATRYWQDVLGDQGLLWLPYQDDPAAMLASGMDLRLWVETGLESVTQR